MDNGFDEAGLPTKFCNQTFCVNCDRDIDADNKVVCCAGCGESGCERCMCRHDDYPEWFCRDDGSCLVAFLDKVIEKLHKQLSSFISNKAKEL